MNELNLPMPAMLTLLVSGVALLAYLATRKTYVEIELLEEELEQEEYQVSSYYGAAYQQRGIYY